MHRPTSKRRRGKRKAESRLEAENNEGETGKRKPETIKRNKANETDEMMESGKRKSTPNVNQFQPQHFASPLLLVPYAQFSLTYNGYKNRHQFVRLLFQMRQLLGRAKLRPLKQFQPVRSLL